MDKKDFMRYYNDRKYIDDRLKEDIGYLNTIDYAVYFDSMRDVREMLNPLDSEEMRKEKVELNNRLIEENKSRDRLGRPLDTFLYYARQGMSPPTDTLYAMASIFDELKRRSGEVKIGQLLYASKEEGWGMDEGRWRLDEFHCGVEMRKERDNGKVNVTKLAENFIGEFELDVDLDAFLRAYRRRKEKRREQAGIYKDKVISRGAYVGCSPKPDWEK